MKRILTILLPLVLVSGTAFGQQPIDPTLDLGGLNATPTTIGGGGARATNECDDFNRANGPMGGAWTDMVGSQWISNNTGQGLAGQGNAYMTHNTGADNYASAVLEYDLLLNPSGSLNYVAMITGYNGWDMLYTKLQGGSGSFTNIGFYIGFNIGGSGGYGGYFGITPVTGGHVWTYVTNAGDTMNVDIDENYDGVVDYHYESSGILGLGVNWGTGVGIGTYGDGTYDNWDLNGGCGGGGPVLTVSNLVAGSTARISVSGATAGGTIRHGYSVYGGGPTSTPYGDLLLSPPYIELTPMTADPSGNASFSSLVPAGTTGVSVWLHAIDMGSLTFTNGLAEVIG